MVTQTSRVDALTKICQALESQLRQMALEKGCTEAKADIAAKWRQEAYKVCHSTLHFIINLFSIWFK